jgi:hypothetical protein
MVAEIASLAFRSRASSTRSSHNRASSRRGSRPSSAFVTLDNGGCSATPRGERRHPKRGSGECRVRAAPAVSCAKLCEETHTSIQVQRRHSGIPRAMVLRLMPCSPRRRIRLVTVVSGLMASLSPVGPTCLRGLGASNGRQDHTVLPYASPRFARRLRRAWYPSGEILANAETAPFVLRAVARSRKPPCEQPARRRCRVHHIPSRVRDDRDPPLLGDETA